MRSRTILKVSGLASLALFAAFAARAEDGGDACGRVEKMFTAHETKITCTEAFVPGIAEFSLYKAMCFGCDPRREFPGDAYDRSGVAFSEASNGISADGASVNVLDDLSRVPSSKTVLSVLFPGIDSRKCRDDKDYLAAHSAACAGLKSSYDGIFGSDGETLAGAVESEAKLRDANQTANTAVVAAIQGDKKAGSYQKACRDQSAQVAKVREAHKAELKKSQAAIWANILRDESTGKGGCLARFVADLPEFWCGKGSAQGQAIDPGACLARLNAKPADLIVKFKAFATNPAVLSARAGGKINPELPSGIQAIRDDSPRKNLRNETDAGTGNSFPTTKVLPGDAVQGN